MSNSNRGKEIKINRLYKLRILIGVAFLIILCGAVASILRWAIVYRPFEKFEHYKEPLIYGNSFDAEGVNVVQIGESGRPYRYEVRYEIDGVVYTVYWTVWGHLGNKHLEFDYLASDPSYTVGNRTFMLIALPIAFIVLCLAEVLVIKAYKRERKKFFTYNRKSIFGGKNEK